MSNPPADTRPAVEQRVLPSIQTAPAAEAPVDPSRKRWEHRAKVASEIYTTEMSYCSSLSACKDVAIPMMREILTPDEMKVLFSNIELITQFNQSLCNDIGDCVKLWSDDSCIGHLFIKFSPFLKMYSEYVTNNEAALNFHRELIEQTRYKRIERDLIGNPRMANAKDLTHFLIMPIQRIPRYLLLLAELIKYTPNTHQDYEQLTHAHSLIAQVAKKVNDAVTQRLERQAMIDAEQELILDKSLVEASRRFIRRGSLTKVCRNKDITYQFFLYNDLLLYCSGQFGRLKPHKFIPIDRNFVVTPGKEPTHFNIINSVKSFTVYSETAAEAQQWYNAMAKCSSDLKAGISKGEAGQTVALWKSDHEATECMLCRKGWTLIRRRHHCRFCGWVVCGDCSRGKSTLNNQQERICDNCASKPIGEQIAQTQLHHEHIDIPQLQSAVNYEALVNNVQHFKEQYLPSVRLYSAKCDSFAALPHLTLHANELLEVYYEHGPLLIGRSKTSQTGGLLHSENVELRPPSEQPNPNRPVNSAVIYTRQTPDPTEYHIKSEFNHILCIMETTPEDDWHIVYDVQNDHIGIVSANDIRDLQLSEFGFVDTTPNPEATPIASASSSLGGNTSVPEQPSSSSAVQPVSTSSSQVPQLSTPVPLPPTTPRTLTTTPEGGPLPSLANKPLPPPPGKGGYATARFPPPGGTPTNKQPGKCTVPNCQCTQMTYTITKKTVCSGCGHADNQH